MGKCACVTRIGMRGKRQAAQLLSFQYAHATRQSIHPSMHSIHLSKMCVRSQHIQVATTKLGSRTPLLKSKFTGSQAQTHRFVSRNSLIPNQVCVHKQQLLQHSRYENRFTLRIIFVGFVFIHLFDCIRSLLLYSIMCWNSEQCTSTTAVRVRLKCIPNLVACWAAIWMKYFPKHATIADCRSHPMSDVWRCTCVNVCCDGEYAHPSLPRSPIVLFSLALPHLIPCACIHIYVYMSRMRNATIAYDAAAAAAVATNSHGVSTAQYYVRACLRLYMFARPFRESYNIPVGFVWLVSHMPAS